MGRFVSIFPVHPPQPKFVSIEAATHGSLFSINNDTNDSSRSAGGIWNGFS